MLRNYLKLLQIITFIMYFINFDTLKTVKRHLITKCVYIGVLKFNLGDFIIVLKTSYTKYYFRLFIIL